MPICKASFSGYTIKPPKYPERDLNPHPKSRFWIYRVCQFRHQGMTGDLHNWSLLLSPYMIFCSGWENHFQKQSTSFLHPQRLGTLRYRRYLTPLYFPKAVRGTINLLIANDQVHSEGIEPSHHSVYEPKSYASAKFRHERLLDFQAKSVNRFYILTISFARSVRPFPGTATSISHYEYSCGLLLLNGCPTTPLYYIK